MTRNRNLITVAVVATTVLSTFASVATAGASSAIAPMSSSTDAADIDEDAEFIFGYTTAPTSIDPIKSTSTFQYLFYDPVFDTLVRQNVDGTLSPAIADAWELSEDGTTFTLTITSGRTFHDGTPIDAAAVAANLERAINHPDSTVADLDNVESIESDGDTVTLTVNGGGGRLPAILADVPGMMLSPASFENEDIDTNPIGSGPFTVVEVGNSGVRYERWDDYYAVDQIDMASFEIVRQLDDHTRMSAVRSGEIDATFIQPAQRAEAESAGLDLVTGVQNYIYAFNLNTMHPALAEADVRKAISHAIDRVAIDEGLQAGACEPTVQPYPEAFWAHAPEATVERYGEHDLDAARELLASGGYPDGFAIEVGAPNTTAFTGLLEVVQAQLSEIGIEVTPVVQEPAQYITAVVQGDLDAWVAPIESGRPDILRFWSDNYMVGGARNPGDFSPTGFADLFTRAANVINVDQQRPILHEMVELSLESGPRVITICVPDYTLVSNDRINGLAVPINGNYSFRGVTESNG